MSRHRADDPSDVPLLYAEIWHVGRSWPGLLLRLEKRCPCVKAECGLVVPSMDIDCDQHRTGKAIRQAHPADNCKTPWVLFRKKTR